MQKNDRRVVVTGMGIMTGAGKNVDEFYDALLNEKTGIKKCTIYDLNQLASDKVSQIDSVSTSRPYEINEETRLLTILNHVLQETWVDASLEKKKIEALYERCIISMGISVGLDEYRYEYINKKKAGNKNLEYLFQSPQNIIDFIRERTGIIGAYHINSSACSASTAAFGEACSAIKNNKADMALVLGVDPLSEFSLYGFNSLKNISPEGCKPFDKNRDGITIGEGGAALVLEEYENAKKRNAKIYAEVFGYGMGNDAYHVTSPDPSGDGAYYTMQMSMNEAGIDWTMLDYINAHGTGTIQNDSMEMEAANRLCTDNSHKVYMNSTKSLTGHCLGAAGAVEIIATVLAVYHDVVFGTYNLDECDNNYETLVIQKDKSKNIKVNYAISNSFAFAGNSASVLIGKVR
ncbi:beta-ketoacyl-[acyl-carrier-protein] synthase family protein [Lachnotalea glycerini]|nr:beta-ketoacyl-[acyl-carrier-protein] synthase family protein [Lachnotalea glycerini]